MTKKVTILGLLLVLIFAIPAFAAINDDVPTVPKDAPYKDVLDKKDDGIAYIDKEEIFNEDVLDYETTIDVKTWEDGAQVGTMEQREVQNVVLVMRFGDRYYIKDVASEQRKMYEGDRIEDAAEKVLNDEASFMWEYPDKELISINGKPWQETKWADYFKQKVKHWLKSSDNLASEDKLWDIFTEPELNSYSHIVYYGRDPNDPDRNVDDILAKFEEYEEGGETGNTEDNETSIKDHVKLTIGEKKAITVIDGGSDVNKLNAAPYIGNGRTMIPLRGSISSLGAELEYNGTEKQVTIEQDEDTVILTIDEKTALVNGEEVTLDKAPETTNGRIFVPIRFVSENLGYTVEWDKDAEMVVVYK